jgi:hypothetical protein
MADKLFTLHIVILNHPGHQHLSITRSTPGGANHRWSVWFVFRSVKNRKFCRSVQGWIHRGPESKSRSTPPNTNHPGIDGVRPRLLRPKFIHKHSPQLLHQLLIVLIRDLRA